MEHWEQLCRDGLRFVYHDDLFHPSTDTFLLSSLPKLKPDMKVCDLGCGTGLLGILLLQRCREIFVTGVELQSPAAALARRCAEENGLGTHMTIHEGDLRALRQHFPTGGFDLIICNPPYYPPQSGRIREESALAAARAETACTLEDICSAAQYLLRWGGKFCLVHKPERLTDVLCTMRHYAMEPKRLRFVCTTAASAPSLFLLEGCRGGKSGLEIQRPLILQTDSGIPTPEVDAIYFRKEEKL